MQTLVMAFVLFSLLLVLNRINIVSWWYLVSDRTFAWRSDHFDGLVALKFDTITADLWSIDMVAISMATI